MVARSNLACFALFFLSTVLITHSMSEARVCRDQLCNEPISVGRVISNFVGTSGKSHLDLKQGENVYIYAKNPDETPEMWFGQTGGKDGYFPKEHVEEYIVYEPNPSYVVSKDILEDTEDSSESGRDNNQNEEKHTHVTSKDEPLKQSDTNSGEGGKGIKGTVSGIIDSLSDFFSLPAGEEEDEHMLISQENLNTDNSEVKLDIRNPNESPNIVQKNENREKKETLSTESTPIYNDEGKGNIDSVKIDHNQNKAVLPLVKNNGQTLGMEHSKETGSEKDVSETEETKKESKVEINSKDEMTGNGQNKEKSKETLNNVNKSEDELSKTEARKYSTFEEKDNQNIEEANGNRVIHENQDNAEDKAWQDQKLMEAAIINAQENVYSDPDESIEDALKIDNAKETFGEGQTTIEDHSVKPPTDSVKLNTMAKDHHQVAENGQDKHLLFPKGGNKLPQFIPGEYMSLPREELMKILDERNKILSSQGDQANDAELQKVFKPTVNNAVNDQTKSQDSLSTDSKITLDEVVQNVQESLKAVVEEDLKNHLGKIKTEEDNGQNKDTSINDGYENTPQDDYSDAARSQENHGNLPKAQQEFLFKGKAIVSHRRHKMEQVINENPGLLSETAALMPSEKHNKEVEDEEEEEEDYEEVEPIRRTTHPSKDVRKSSEGAILEKEPSTHPSKDVHKSSEGAILEKEPPTHPSKDVHKSSEGAILEKEPPTHPSKDVRKSSEGAILEKEPPTHPSKDVHKSSEGAILEKEPPTHPSKDVHKSSEGAILEKEPPTHPSKDVHKSSEGAILEKEPPTHPSKDVHKSSEGAILEKESQNDTTSKNSSDSREADAKDKIVIKSKEQSFNIGEYEKSWRQEKGRVNEEQPKGYVGDADQKSALPQMEIEKENKIEEQNQLDKEREIEKQLKLLVEEQKRREAFNEQEELQNKLQKKKELERKVEQERLKTEEQIRKEEEEEEKRLRHQEDEKKQEEELRRIQEEAENRKKEDGRRERIKLEVEKRLKAIEDQKRKEEEEKAKKEEERKEQERINKEKQRLEELEEKKRKEEDQKKKQAEAKKEEERKEQERINKEKQQRLEELEEKKRKEEERRNKIEQERKREDKEKEKADKLTEEMEIEAALKERLAAMSSEVKPSLQQQDPVLHNPTVNNKRHEETVLKDYQSQQDSSVTKSGKVLQSKQNLMQNKFKKMKLKTVKGGKKVNKSKKGKKKKKKRRSYDMSDIHLDQESCESIPMRGREVCGLDLTEEECHEDGCCFDEDSAPDIQCFYPPNESVSKRHDDFDDDEEEIIAKKRLVTKHIKRVELKTVNTIINSKTADPTILATPASLYTSDIICKNTADANDMKLAEQAKLIPVVKQSGDQQSLEVQLETRQETTQKQSSVLPVQPTPRIEMTSLNTDKIQESSSEKSTDELVKAKTQQPDESEVDMGNASVQSSHHDQTHKPNPADIFESTLPSTSDTADTVKPADNATEPLRSKSFGVLRGFLRCHEVFAENVMFYGLPVKGALQGMLGFIGLGQVFDDICQDLASAPPVVLICTILVGTLGAVFLLSSCISSFSSKGQASGPSLRDILKTYEARIHILEDERDGLETSNKEMQLKLQHALEEKHHADDGASTARKNLEHAMLKTKQYEEEHKQLQTIITSNKEEMKAFIEELEKKDEDFEHLQKKLDDYKEQVNSKQSAMEQLKEEIIKLEESNVSLDKQINGLNNKVDRQNEEKNKLAEQLKEWNDKFDKLQHSLDDQALCNSQIQEQHEFKCNEVEVLQDCLLQIKGHSDDDEDEDTLTEEEKDKERSNRLKTMLDASKSKTEGKIMRQEIDMCKGELEETTAIKKALEDKIQNIQLQLSQGKLNEEKAYLDFREKEIELAALRKYFKDTESDLHRKLTAEESARQATENKLKVELSKASADSQDLVTYKKLYADINEEIKRVKGNVNHQVAQVEERAHDNWLKYRTVERELEEVKRERDALRRRVYAVDKEKNRPGSSQSGKSSDSADGVRSESPLRGPPPSGHPGHVPEHHSPVPIALPPTPIHPMYGAPRIPMGYCPPPPPLVRYGPPPPPVHMATPPPPGHMAMPQPHGNGPASQNSVDDKQPHESPPPYVPYPSGTSLRLGPPMMRPPPPVRPHYGPVGPPHAPAYGSPIGPPAGLPRIRPPKPLPPGHSPGPGAPPVGSNAYRRAASRPPNNSPLS